MEQDVLKQAEHIAEDFKGFTDGVRVLMLIHRKKEGGRDQRDISAIKRISRNHEEFVEYLYDLLILKNASDDPLRIYSCVNSRDMEKTIRMFKFVQLESDFYDTDSRHGFYFDVRNRFLSALMSPRCATSKYFIIDVDEIGELTSVLMEIATAGLNDNIVKQYPTKSGWHIVMRPFNPALLPVNASKIHRDSLILINH